MSRGAPSRALICHAVRRTASAMAGMLASPNRVSGPETLMLATTAPVRSKTGATWPTEPVVTCPSAAHRDQACPPAT